MSCVAPVPTLTVPWTRRMDWACPTEAMVNKFCQCSITIPSQSLARPLVHIIVDYFRIVFHKSGLLFIAQRWFYCHRCISLMIFQWPATFSSPSCTYIMEIYPKSVLVCSIWESHRVYISDPFHEMFVAFIICDIELIFLWTYFLFCLAFRLLARRTFDGHRTDYDRRV